MHQPKNHYENEGRTHKYFTVPINSVVEALPMAADNEAKQIEKIATTVIDANNVSEKDSALVNKNFPSGTFLFHSATTSSLVNILRDGSLYNGAALGGEHATNGGSEAISWSLGGIEAMPATRHHIAGFIAAPELVVTQQQELVVPDRAAPYEVTQVPTAINPTAFYDTYARARQLEREYHMLKETDPQSADTRRTQILAMKAQLADALSDSPAVAVPIDRMFFVTSQSDLLQWLRVIARCGVKPAGIITYDNTNVFMEDFVQTERGHGAALYEQLRQAIPVQPDKTIEYSDVLGKEFTDALRSTAEPYTMDDEHRLKAHTIRNLGGGVLDIASRKL